MGAAIGLVVTSLLLIGVFMSQLNIPGMALGTVSLVIAFSLLAIGAGRGWWHMDWWKRR